MSSDPPTEKQPETHGRQARS